MSPFTLTLFLVFCFPLGQEVSPATSLSRVRCSTFLTPIARVQPPSAPSSHGIPLALRWKAGLHAAVPKPFLLLSQEQPMSIELPLSPPLPKHWLTVGVLYQIVCKTLDTCLYLGCCCQHSWALLLQSASVAESSDVISFGLPSRVRATPEMVFFLLATYNN